MTPTTAAALAGLQAVPSGFEATFDPEDARVPEMRQMTAQHLRSWGLEASVDSAVLVVSELTTNAIQHGDGTVNLRVQYCHPVLHIEVADSSPAPARMRIAGEADENGRGLVLVDKLAQNWGVSDGGTTTWAVLALPPSET